MKVDTSQQRRTNLVDFFTKSLWLLSCVGMAASSLIWFGEDFQAYYAAGRVLLAGRNPYDFSLVAAVLKQVTGTASNHPFYYPLWFGWLMVPLAALPYQVARAVWMGINVLLWIFALIYLNQLLQWPSRGWRQYLMASFATVLLAWVTWRFEQIGILLLFLLVTALAALRSHRWILGGFLMALLLVKPTVTLLLVGAILLWLLRQGQMRPLLSVLATSLALTAVTTLATPAWYSPWLKSGFSARLYTEMQPSGQIEAVRINTTMLDWLTPVVQNPSWRIAIYAGTALMILGIVIAVVLRSDSLLPVAVASLLANFLITPYALQYDFPMLAIVLYWSVALLVRSKRGLWVGLILIGFVTSVLFWERPISDAYWMVLGLTALAAWSWYQARAFMLPESLSWNATRLWEKT